MDYAALIASTLAPLGIPIKERIYTGTKPVYIVFTCYFIGPAAAAANRTVEREYDFMINIYQQSGDASVDFGALREQAVGLLEAAGFNNVTAVDRTDLEKVRETAKYNRWLIDCSYTDNIQ